MSTMPERVWAVEPHGNCGWSATLMPVFYTEVGDTKPLGSVAHPYVPEQRALAAERERDAYRTVAETADESWTALRAERDALRADLLALAPLVQAALHSWDYVWAKQVMPDTEVPKLTLNREQVTAARAILARVAKEEGT